MIRCFFYRYKLARSVDAELDLEPGLQRHVQECSSCREFYKQELSVARRLTRSAGSVRITPSPFLQPRILAAVERAERPTQPRPLLRRVIATAGLAAALVVTFLAFHGLPSPPPPPAAPDLASVIKELAALEKTLPSDQNLEQWSGTVDAPLDKEMRSLVHDARGAAQMLVQNFLPDTVVRLPGEDKGDN